MKKRVLRIVLIVLGLLLAILLIGPFLIPIPPLEGTVPPEQLADPDSRFIVIDLNGVNLNVHYKLIGSGEPAFVLLHGFGASLFSWREVMGPLSQLGTVVAFDRPAFGLTERPLPGAWSGDSPYGAEAQAALTIKLMDRLGVERAILVGNSAGGSIAMQTALAHPDRIEALALVDPAVYAGGGTPGWLRPILHTPQAQRVGPLLMRNIRTWGIDFAKSAWHDPTRITPDIWEGYTRPLQADDWDQGLWQLILASRAPDLANRLDEIRMPALVVTGDDDRIVPTEQSIRLAGELPDAQLVVIAFCGHVPHEECPSEFMQALTRFVAQLPPR
jgi:pimeloyl-ACP methyl ester carboxylesterase